MILSWGVGLSPATGDEWFQEGLNALKAGKYAEAIEAFTMTIKAVPHDYEALNNRCFARIFIGDYVGAVDDCTQALSINPQSEKSFNNRGFARIFQEDYDGAVTDINRAIDINPRYVDAYCNRGLAWLRKGHYEKAIEDCTAALRINPRSSKALYNRGYALDKMGAPGRALLDYAQALTINPDYTEIFNNLAWILATCPDHRYRDGRRAVAFAKRAVDRSPVIGHLDTLAAAYAEAGRFEEAVAIQSQLLAMTVAPGHKSTIPYAKRLSHYEEGKPFRENYSPKPGGNPREVWQKIAPLDRLVDLPSEAERPEDPPAAVDSGVNHPPVAGRLFYETKEDEPVDILLTGKDPDGTPIRFEITASPTRGTLSGSPPRLVYHPEPEFAGTDRFRYQVLDGTDASETGSVVIRVEAVNDAPAPVSKTVDGIEDQPVALQLAATDPEDGPLRYEIADPPTHGRLQGDPPGLIYQPNPDFSGEDQFTFRAADGQAVSTPATVRLIIRPVNDPPMAEGRQVRIRRNTDIALDLSGTDPDGDPLVFSLVGLPEHGSISGNPPRIQYQPHEDFLGEDRIVFRASDGQLESPEAVIQMTVSDADPTASRTPGPAAAKTTRDTPVMVSLIPKGAEGTQWDVIMETVPINGVLSGTLPDLVYTPKPGFIGTDEFSYRLTDGSNPSELIRYTIVVAESLPSTEDGRTVSPEPEGPAPPSVSGGPSAPTSESTDASRRETDQPAEAAAAADNAASGRFNTAAFAVQVQSVKSREDADKAVSELAGKGFSAFSREAVIRDRGTWHRIYIGPFETSKGAKQAADQIRRSLSPNAFVTRLGSPKANRGPDVPEMAKAARETPYAYQVRSFSKQSEARRLAETLRSKGRKAFIGQASVKKGETWHRVYIGAYSSPSVAEAARKAFSGDELAGVFLVYLPYCLELSQEGGTESIDDMERTLSEAGFVPYRLPDPTVPGRHRLAVGGFYKKKDTSDLRRQLESAGFSPRLTRR
jgi:cell division septation protein DedD/Flp pilus assembly protein TadD